MIIARTLTTPNLVVLNSKHRHDYVFINENEHHYMLDGGCLSGYYRSSGTENGGVIKEYTEWDNIEEIREVFHWGVNYDKDSKRLVLSPEETKEWLKTKIAKYIRESDPIQYQEIIEGIRFIPRDAEYKLLKDLGDDHLDALFGYSKLDWQKILWIKEKLHRAEEEYE